MANIFLRRVVVCKHSHILAIITLSSFGQCRSCHRLPLVFVRSNVRELLRKSLFRAISAKQPARQIVSQSKAKLQQPSAKPKKPRSKRKKEKAVQKDVEQQAKEETALPTVEAKPCEITTEIAEAKKQLKAVLQSQVAQESSPVSPFSKTFAKTLSERKLKKLQQQLWKHRHSKVLQKLENRGTAEQRTQKQIADAAEPAVQAGMVEDVSQIRSGDLDKDVEDAELVEHAVDASEERINEVAELSTANDEEFGDVAAKSDDAAEKRETLATHKHLQSVAQFRAFVDVSISIGKVEQAHAMVHHYLQKQGKINVKNLEIYNLLARGWAKKGHTEAVREIFEWMKQHRMSPSYQTYAAMFEALAQRVPFDADFGESLATEMERKGMKLEDIFNNCNFMGEERKKILEAIYQIRPDYVADCVPARGGYTCHLVERLNEKSDQVLQDTPYTGILSAAELSRFAARQYKMEVDGQIVIKSVERQLETDERMAEYRKKLHESQQTWRKVLHKSIERNVKMLSHQIQGKAVNISTNILPFLFAIKTDSIVDLLLEEIRLLAESSEAYSPHILILYRTLGSRVYNRFVIQKKIDNGIADKLQLLYEDYLKYFVNVDLNSHHNQREYWYHLIDSHLDGPTVGMEEERWPNHVLVAIGRFLYKILLNDVKIDVSTQRDKQKRYMPAFYSIFRYVSVKTKEEIKPHPALAKLYKAACDTDLRFEANMVPMYSPPIPWNSVHHGGFILSPSLLMRLASDAPQQQELLRNTPSNKLYPIFDALNQLGATAWTINQPVLDVILDLFNNNGSAELDVAPPISECPPLPKITSDMSKQEKMKVTAQRTALRRKRAEMYSLWCDALYKLSIANHFRDDVFWFPHNMDFRGRVYPCPPHFNHLGSDLCRSVLLFAKGQPLRERGFDWLKIHLINLTGFKKRDSVSERLKYANEMLPEIMDSAERPMTGNKWWQSSDEPWQTLACCMEIAKVVRSSDPENYLCRLPVHQDGSCNGLQHYAALGRDKHGAEQVNLHPFDVPQDVYSGVAALVENLRAKDAEDGVEVARILQGYVSRKVVKQTVMTVVYGVTRYGARLQILRRLKDIPEFPSKYSWQAAGYLVQKTFQSLSEMFTATREIQDWLTDCARLIAQIRMEPVQWVTPLDLPIVQPYFRIDKVPKSKEKGKAVRVERPNVLKQKNAFPPNFIHSLDSTHMMLTSLFCQRAGITFASVHDCYWTHASTVSVMNRICREQFVALHSLPILEDLSQFLAEHYSFPAKDIPTDGSAEDIMRRRLNKLLTLVPERGTFELEKVLKSVYFFS